MEFNRISVNPYQMGGVPCIRGLRIPVSTILSLLSEKLTTDEIISMYPDLEKDDISEALVFASLAVSERELPLIKTR